MKLINPFEIEEYISRIDYSIATLRQELDRSIQENERKKEESNDGVRLQETKKVEEKVVTEHSLNVFS